MRYTIKVITDEIEDHNHYASEEEVCEALFELVVESEEVGAVLTFSDDNKEQPISNEVLVMVYDGNEILIPTSEGGTWEAFDNYLNEEIDVMLEVGEDRTEYLDHDN